MRRDDTVYIVDDEAEMCRSLAMLLAVDGIASRCFGSAEAFLAELPQLPSGVIVSDVALPGMSGVDLLHTQAVRDRGDPLIIMTAHGEVSLAVEALKGGAVDFIEKPYEAATMLSAVHAARARIEDAQHTSACLNSLSPRERQVLSHIVDGLTSKQIALALGLSPRTVETYRQHLMEKTGATSLSQLVRFGLRAGLEPG